MKTLKKILITMLVMFVSSGVISDFKIQSDASSIPDITISNTETGTIKNGLAQTGKKKVLNKVLEEYRMVIVFISGTGTLSMIMFFILNFISLGNSKGNPQARQQAIHGLIVTGIATAGLGSVTMITTLFYNMLNLDNK